MIGNKYPPVNSNLIFDLISEALDLVNAAIQLDNTHNYTCACDYYDMAILNFNEAMNKLKFNSPVWNKLMELRSKYDERLVFLYLKKYIHLSKCVF